MKRYSKVTPEGTRDILFEECSARRKVESTLSELFKQLGYNRVITPAIEFFDVFDRESAGMRPESLYKLVDRRGRLLVLRPDNTMPIARMVATRLKDMPMPVRLYYSQNVFRIHPGLSGHSDEIYQSGIELMGASGIRADLEVITTAVEALKRCGAPDFCLEISHAGIFNAIVSNLHVDAETREDLTQLIESKNYAALNDLLDKIGDSPETQAIRRMPRLFGGIEALDEAQALIQSEEASVALSYLRKLYHRLSALETGANIRIDLGQVHRGNYYTGVVFRGYIEGSGITVLNGGRYDHLTEEFDAPLPAVGFGVEVDALAKAMLQRGEVEPPKKADVLVFGENGKEIQAVAYARSLSENGLSGENCVCETLEEAKAYASMRGIRRLDVVGDNGVTSITIEEVFYEAN